MTGVATWAQSDFTTQDPTTYRTALDGNNMVSANIVDAFACHQAVTANMTIMVDAGIVSAAGSNPTAVGQQTSAAMTAPVVNPRNDLVVVSAATGALSIIEGTEAATPADPSVTAGKIAVARIRHVVGEAAITNSMIDDLRAGSAIPATLPLPPIGNSSGNLLAGGDDYAADTSATVNVITITLSPAPSAYYTGMKFKAKIANANTGATVINVNGLGNKSVVKGGTTALVGGELPQGWVADFIYDGTSVQLMNPAAPKASALMAPTVVTTIGATTVTIPAGATSAKITVTGPGGGGGDSLSAESGGGGGAGGTAIKWLSGITPGDTLTATVTAGGTPAANSAPSTLASGSQGIATITGGAGAAGAPGAPGSPGSGSGGDLNLSGGYGGTGRYNEGAYLDGGDGGASYWGGGGNGGNNGSNGNGGAAYGSGGGGAGVGASTHVGGNGAQGVIVIEWHP